jgi:NAD-dependent dihydropyrimidine dehydrogenase PreA subunit
MRIDDTVCTSCWECLPYCPVGAILPEDGVVRIDEEQCVECGTCLRTVPCPSGAIYENESVNDWPRNVRKVFSDPKAVHKHTNVPGRGTEECKTNDVTGRVKRGRIGIALELGRPGIGTDFHDVEKVSTALAALGVHFEPCNPLTNLMSDTSTGKIRDDVKGERVLSAIVEIETEIDRLKPIMETIRKVTGEIKTVYSLDLICRFDPDGGIPVLPALRELGIEPRANAKINIGAGRPLSGL